MTKLMMGILIDPWALTVMEVEVEHGGDGIRKAMADALPPIVPQLLDRVKLDDGVDLWIDDEAVLLPGNQYWLANRDKKAPLLAGMGLVLGVTPDGETVSLPYYQRWRNMLREKVSFLGNAAAVEEEIDNGLVERPVSTMSVNGEAPVEIWRWEGADVL